MRAVQITRFMHSRWLVLIMALALVCVAMTAYTNIPVEYLAGDRGLVLPSANLWIPNPHTAMWVNIGATLGLAALMVVLNRSYNLLRTMTLLDASLFLAMSMSTPWLLVQFYTGTPLCITLIVCTLLLYSTYQNPCRRKRIFLIFFLLSAMTMTQYCYAVYIPVFIIGSMQMRIFSIKTLIAIILGTITPWWMMLGSGLVTVSDIHIPDFGNMFGTFYLVDNLQLLVAVLISATVLVAGWCLNFPRMIAYNAHMRAYNGTMSVLSLVTLIALCADFINLPAYAPVLFMCASFYMGRMFAAQASPKSYIPITTIFLIYATLLTWSLIP